MHDRSVDLRQSILGSKAEPSRKNARCHGTLSNADSLATRGWPPEFGRYGKRVFQIGSLWQGKSVIGGCLFPAPFGRIELSSVIGHCSSMKTFL
jgi:hypothetical protein